MKLRIVTTEYLISNDGILLFDTLIPIKELVTNLTPNFVISEKVISATVQDFLSLGISQDKISGHKVETVNIKERLKELPFNVKWKYFGYVSLIPTFLDEEYLEYWLNYKASLHNSTELLTLIGLRPLVNFNTSLNSMLSLNIRKL